MLTTTIDALREENAKFAREAEYLKETAADDMLDVCMESAESAVLGTEKISELEEAAQMVNKMPVEETDVTESAEVERILSAKEDISFNEMAGIE